IFSGPHNGRGSGNGKAYGTPQVSPWDRKRHRPDPAKRLSNVILGPPPRSAGGELTWLLRRLFGSDQRAGAFWFFQRERQRMIGAAESRQYQSNRGRIIAHALALPRCQPADRQCARAPGNRAAL